MKKKTIAIEIVITLCIGVVAIPLMMYLEGIQQSLSAYAKHTDTIIIFKVWMLSLAYGAYRSSDMKGAHIPAILIAVFDLSIDNGYMDALHNMSAIIFMAVMIVALYERYKTTSMLITISLLTYPIIGMYYGELLTIIIMYGHYIRKATKLIV